MNNICYINGQYIDQYETSVSPIDRGFLLGDGLFETLRCYKGKPFSLVQHWHRLTTGAAAIKLPLPESLETIQRVIHKLLTVNNHLNHDSVVRITITRGPSGRGITLPNKTKTTILIQSVAASTLSPRSISLTNTKVIHNEYSPLCGFKTTNYLEKIQAKQLANQLGFNDALLLNTQKQLVSTTTANLFLIKDNILFTPALSSGALPGITRHHCLAIAKEENIISQEAVLLIEDLQHADAVFVTNSVIETQLVSRINTINYDTDTPNPIYLKITVGYRALASEQML